MEKEKMPRKRMEVKKRTRTRKVKGIMMMLRQRMEVRKRGTTRMKMTKMKKWLKKKKK